MFKECLLQDNRKYSWKGDGPEHVILKLLTSRRIFISKECGIALKGVPLTPGSGT